MTPWVRIAWAKLSDEQKEDVYTHADAVCKYIVNDNSRHAAVAHLSELVRKYKFIAEDCGTHLKSIRESGANIVYISEIEAAFSFLQTILKTRPKPVVEEEPKPVAHTVAQPRTIAVNSSTTYNTQMMSTTTATTRTTAEIKEKYTGKKFEVRHVLYGLVVGFVLESTDSDYVMDLYKGDEKVIGGFPISKDSPNIVRELW